MPAASFVRSAYLRYFSQPAGERILYRAAHKRPIRRIVELGVRTGVRTKNLMEIVLRHNPGESVRYTGIDLFEARPAGMPGMTLKQAHVWSKTLGVRTEMVPGDACTALSRVANRLTNVDLFIVSSTVEEHALRRAWFYVPRMLHPGSVVIVETENNAENNAEGSRYDRVSNTTVQVLADQGNAERKAA